MFSKSFELASPAPARKWLWAEWEGPWAEGLGWWSFPDGRDLRNISPLFHTGTWPLCVFVLQAKDKDHWVRLFSQFCSKTANEEEEIVHKLLGDKFKVGFLSWPPLPTPQVAWGDCGYL